MNRTELKATLPERLARAGRMLEDGASQLETVRSTHVARETLVKHFPGMKWTYKQGGEFRALTRYTKPKEQLTR